MLRKSYPTILATNQDGRLMNALKKDSSSFVVQDRGERSGVGVFHVYSTSSGSICVMDKKTFDGATDASNKLIRETVNKIRSEADKQAHNE